MFTTFLAYIIIAAFLLVEGRLRKGQEAQSYERGQFDQRSTMFIGIAFFIGTLALLLALLLDWLKIAVLSAWIGWLGIGIALSGFGIRVWANRVLGAFYTRTLKVTENQFIVHDGPYRLIRHPGYLGSILMWIGAATATTNWIVMLITLLVMLSAYVYRIQNEEKMLLTTNTEYAEYQAHTWRLIPFVY
jgi:protein-S-isoprenylcysteine O-methyltransferase Ste14